MPATSLMGICRVLKSLSPRLIEFRAAFRSPSLTCAHLLYRLKMLDVNCPSPGVTSPPGCSKAGTKKWTLEFTVMKKGCVERDRKSTRLNSSHSQISYAVFCLKKKNDLVAGHQWCVPLYYPPA